MAIKNKDFFLNLIKTEVIPALGCTEPIAVALASSKAASLLSYDIKKINIFVSANILKNGMGVGIPGTGMVGLHIAAALGALGGNSDANLEVLKDITQDQIADSKLFVKENNVSVSVKDVPNKLYIEAELFDGKNTSRVIIKDKHSNITFIQLNDSILLNVSEENLKSVKECENPGVFATIEDIFNFATTCDFEDIKFILDGASMNKKISYEGLKNNYGLKVGKTIIKNIEKGLLSKDIQNYAMAYTAAASDARMAGCMLPVMSNSGSGNQGITVMMPVVAVSEQLNICEEKLARALILANLTAIHIKAYLGRLSALCGCVVASSGASCGIAYLLGGNLKHINYAIKNMAGNIVGMICDGAKTGCALKVSTGVSAAVQAALLAVDEIQIGCTDGIIDVDIEKTIQNLATIGTKGMVETDKLILDIMTCK